MNCFTNPTLYQFPNYCLETGGSVVKSGVKRLSNLSYSLNPLKDVRMIASVVVDIFALIPLAANGLPLRTIKNILTPIKIGIEFLKGFRRIDEFLSGAVNSWKLVLLNISGLALFFFSGIEVLEYFKIQLKGIHKAAAKIPILGALPFAGCLNFAWIGYCVASLAIDLDTKKNNQPTWSKADAKLEFWSKPLDQFKVQTKLSHYEQKILKAGNDGKILSLKTKQKTWIEVQKQFDRLEKPLALVSQYKTDKWKKRVLEKQYNKVSIVEGIISIGGLSLISLLAISGIGATVLGAVGVAIAIPEACCGIHNFIWELRIKWLKPIPIELETIRSV